MLPNFLLGFLLPCVCAERARQSGETQRTRFLLLIGLWAVAFPLFAQQDAADTTAASTQGPTVEEGKLYLAPLPVLAANPAFGFIYGAAAFYLNLNETF